MLLITAAMEAELQACIPGQTRSSSKGTHQFHEYPVCLGSASAAEIGVGKAVSAFRMGELLERYRPEEVIHIGICGAAHPSFQVGELLLPSRVMQYDLHLKEFGLDRGVIPFCAVGEAAADTKMLESTQKILTGMVKGRRVHTGGLIASGDQFASVHTKQLLAAEGIDACDMESFSVALACRLKGIPFVIWKIISDDAAGRRVRRFSRFLADASQLFRAAVEAYLESRKSLQ